ncbi:MAG: T9SS type A sorting domain-containing protein, partial [Bacteroidales bacterium]|nr:T9SS type A sorting domain-containing protein [Bacteroidales bacterium]
QWMEANKISWCKWALHHKDNSCATLHDWASWSGGWSDSDLTENGIQTKYDLHNYYTPDPDDPPPPPDPPGNTTFNIFPNPAGTEIMVLVENDPVTTPLTLKFYDATRKLVYEHTIESAVSHIPVTLPKGIYFIYMERNNTELAERVLIL